MGFAICNLSASLARRATSHKLGGICIFRERNANALAAPACLPTYPAHTRTRPIHSNAPNAPSLIHAVILDMFKNRR